MGRFPGNQEEPMTRGRKKQQSPEPAILNAQAGGLGGGRFPRLGSTLQFQSPYSLPAAGGLSRVLGSPWFAILVLVAAVLASYANSLRCPFVFDDHNDIVDNPSIRRLWPLWDVFLVRSGVPPGCNPGLW